MEYSLSYELGSLRIRTEPENPVEANVPEKAQICFAGLRIPLLHRFAGAAFDSTILQ